MIGIRKYPADRTENSDRLPETKDGIIAILECWGNAVDACVWWNKSLADRAVIDKRYPETTIVGTHTTQRILYDALLCKSMLSILSAIVNRMAIPSDFSVTSLGGASGPAVEWIPTASNDIGDSIRIFQTNVVIPGEEGRPILRSATCNWAWVDTMVCVVDFCSRPRGYTLYPIGMDRWLKLCQVMSDALCALPPDVLPPLSRYTDDKDDVYVVEVLPPA